MENVFVYGSLRQGLHNHFLLEQSAFLGMAETTGQWQLIDLGPFPAALNQGTGTIVGEVYRVSEQTFAELDLLEGYPAWYQRCLIDTPYGSAWIYFQQQAEPGSVPVPDGDWLPHFRRKAQAEADWLEERFDDAPAFPDGLDFGRGSDY